MNHRIMESFRLEKTSKIIRSNRQPNTTMPAKPYPEVIDPALLACDKISLEARRAPLQKLEIAL